MESNRSPPLVLQLQRTCFKMTSRQKKMISCLHEVKNQEEEMEPFYEILPASAPVPHQSPAEEVIQSNSDHTLFLKRDEGKLTALIVYVDDIIVTGNDAEEQLKLQNYLSQDFEMKDLGDLKYFLGIEVARSKTGIFLSQRKYVMDLLTETGMFGCKPADTPIEMNHKLREDMDQEPTNKG
ncbi:unnamed protein product [Prunus armeniaca]